MRGTSYGQSKGTHCPYDVPAGQPESSAGRTLGAVGSGMPGSNEGSWRVHTELIAFDGRLDLQSIDSVPLGGEAVPANSLIAFDPTDDATRATITTGLPGNTVEVDLSYLSARPELDLAGWEDAVEFSLETATGLVVVEDTADVTVVTERAGDLRVRVKAAGRLQARQAGDDEADPAPIERYSIEVWPEQPTKASVLIGCGPLEGAPFDWRTLPEYEAGIAGARSIGRDLDARVTLSGRTTDLALERVVTGTPRQLFKTFAYSLGWFRRYTTYGWLDGPTRTAFVASDQPKAEGGDRLTGTGGYIELRLQRAKRPAGATLQCQWYVPDAATNYAVLGEGVPFLETPTILETSLRPLSSAGDRETTRAGIAHREVPVEWAAALEAHWRLHLACVQGFTARP